MTSPALRARSALRYGVIIGLLLLVSLPFLWVLMGSFRPNVELIDPARAFEIETFTFDNYVRLWQAAAYIVYLRNSLIVALLSTLIAVPLALLAAFSVYRFRYPARKQLYLLMLITFVFPEIVLLIPLFLLFNSIGLIDNLLSLVMMNVTFAAPFSVWLMRGFFGSIPRNVEEAAQLDGAGPLRLLRSIIIPLVAPGVAVAATYTFIISWTEFTFANAFIISGNLTTLPVGLSGFVAQYYVDWGILSAAAISVAAPVVLIFAFVGRYFVQGLTAGAER